MATFTTNKELEAFRAKHQEKLNQLEKKINFNDVREYETLKEEKRIMSRAYSIGDWIKWSESEDDGCNGTCARFFSGEIQSINFDSWKYVVKSEDGKTLYCGFSQALKIKAPKKAEEPTLSEIKETVRIRRPFGGY